MDYYKDFTYQLRKLIYTNDVYIYLRRVTPKLLQIVRLLTEVKFEDGHYHTYYGEIKRIMGGFLTYFYIVIDEIHKDADRLYHLATRADLMELVEKTINIHNDNQQDFLKDYTPVNKAEVNNVEEIKGLYLTFMERVYDLQREVWSLYEVDIAREFAKNHFEKSVQEANRLCNFAYTYYSLMLAEDLDKTRVSLIEIHKRINNNKKEMKSKSEDLLHTLYNELYGYHKESICVNRQETLPVLEFIEKSSISRRIESMQAVIGHFDANEYIGKIKKEVKFWQSKLDEFYIVAGNLHRIKEKLQKLEKQDQLANESDKPHTCIKSGGKVSCTTLKKQLEEQWAKEARTLLTFYACRGLDRILYQDNMGKYYLDEYNHQVYVQDYGLKDYHISCSKALVTPEEKEYFFDNHGRYVYHGGHKVYQLAPCASLYNLGADKLLTRCEDAKELGMTETEFRNAQCRRKIKDPSDVTFVPDVEPIDITNTMSKENAEYLWDTFASILPHALKDVAGSKSKNPIHYLAHRLLYHKYFSSKKELRERKSDADAFKAQILNERKEKAYIRSKEWKSKQVKRRRPEESDDAQERAVFDAQMAQREFINSLNYYYY